MTQVPPDDRQRRDPSVVRRWMLGGGALVVAAMLVVLVADGDRQGAVEDPGDAGDGSTDVADGGDRGATAADAPEPVDPPSWTSVAPYSDDSPWNTPLDEDAPVHPDSEAFLERIGESFTMDTSQYTLPVYEVDEDTPSVTVEVEHLFSEVAGHGTSLDRHQEATVEVPIPDGAEAAAGTDAQIVIVDTGTGEEWGFWHLEESDDGYRATNGYRYHVGWNAVPPEGFGSRGAGVPYLTGLIRPQQLEEGRIDHAIAFAYPTPSPEHVHPATKSDGPGEPGVDLPEGARLRLDPSLDRDELEELGLDEHGRTIARALQEYGMILIDIAGRPKIYAEYDGTADWDGRITEDTISALPLEAFEVVDWDAADPDVLAQPTAPELAPVGSDLVLDGTASVAPAGTVERYEWVDDDGRVIGEEATVRYATDDLETGTHRFGLRVADRDGDWSEVRHVDVDVEEVDGPFVAATHEASEADVDAVSTSTGTLDDGERLAIGVVVRRVNEDDDVGVDAVTGAGASWERVTREVDGRGTLALEIWAGEPVDGADGSEEVEVRLTDTTNVAVQAVRVGGVDATVSRAGAASDAEQASEGELAVDASTGDLVLGFHGGRTEDVTLEGPGEVNISNTVVDDEGGSVRISSVTAHPERDGPVEFGGVTRSPMDWTMAGVAFGEG